MIARSCRWLLRQFFTRRKMLIFIVICCSPIHLFTFFKARQNIFGLFLNVLSSGSHQNLHQNQAFITAAAKTLHYFDLYAIAARFLVVDRDISTLSSPLQ